MESSSKDKTIKMTTKEDRNDDTSRDKRSSSGAFSHLDIVHSDIFEVRFNEQFDDLKKRYQEKKDAYIKALNELIQKEISNVIHADSECRDFGFDPNEIVQNHLKLLLDCFPDVPPLPSSMNTRFDRRPNAILKQHADSITSKHGNIQEEPLNLTREDIESNSTRSLSEPLNVSDDKTSKYDARGNANSNNGIDTATVEREEATMPITSSVGKSRPNPPLSIDMPSIGAVAALSTAAVVSPVVAMAAVGYGVVKILSGNQANGEEQVNENDTDTMDGNEENSTQKDLPSTIVTEPCPSSKIPERNSNVKRTVNDDGYRSFNSPSRSNIYRSTGEQRFYDRLTEASVSAEFCPSDYQLPDPLVPQPTESSKLAAKKGSIKGLQELCKGLFWSSEDLSIPAAADNKKRGNDLALDAPWCTNDLASVHSRLRELDEGKKEYESVEEDNNDLQQFGAYNDDTSIRVFPADPVNEENSEQDTTFQLTDDGRAIEGNKILYYSIKSLLLL